MSSMPTLNMNTPVKTDMELQMSRDSCMVCGTSEFKAVCEKSGFIYVSCATCEVVRQFPYPEEYEIVEYYTDYKTKKAADSVYLTDAGFEIFKRDKELTFADLGLVGGFVGKSILDVGCGTGQFVQMMAQEAGSIKGIDISGECISLARDRNLNCESQDFLALNEVHDVITMWHIIEHTLKPRQYIEHAYQMLASGGLLLIETPVIGVISTGFGADWRYFMPVEHINLFTQNALFRVCTDAGFRIQSWIRFGSGNEAGTVPASNKRAMDLSAKKLGFGDTIAAVFVK